MFRSLELPKVSPESVARALFDGVEKGEEEIFPDPLSELLTESWRSGALKRFERPSWQHHEHTARLPNEETRMFTEHPLEVQSAQPDDRELERDVVFL